MDQANSQTVHTLSVLGCSTLFEVPSSPILRLRNIVQTTWQNLRTGDSVEEKSHQWQPPNQKFSGKRKNHIEPTWMDRSWGSLWHWLVSSRVRLSTPHYSQAKKLPATVQHLMSNPLLDKPGSCYGVYLGYGSKCYGRSMDKRSSHSTAPWPWLSTC